MEISYDKKISLPQGPPIHYEGYNSKAPPRPTYSPSSPKAISPAVVTPITPPLTPPLEDDDAQPYYEKMNAPKQKISFKKSKELNTT